ncbi:MAG: hypothetical protein AUH83_04075 [Deltaproteobacteria bacterium 13_1_40CM_4_68_19]|nr:MAG: hypothetical protein AUH83_04075 [Deltaproteobacteria bacterium 13_1_40CM_4_68_19]
MRMTIRLAALASLVSFAAAAGSHRATFQVGAIVIASATVSSAFKAGGSGDGIEVRLGGHRALSAAVLVASPPRPAPAPW